LPAVVVDGLFRNLLVDVTGNSHRAEFCVDKLYPPEGLGLQLGLLELRAFEMAPHVQMNLLQMLLIRALVSMFWKTPFEGGLVRWGTALHDRFMLPHFVRRDFREVLASCASCRATTSRTSGLPRIGVSLSEDRVDRCGRSRTRTASGPRALERARGGDLSGRTVRTVDSSLERMQVKVSGFTTESRYVVACNGRRVPLQPPASPAQRWLGVRYRARRLSASLHPTIPVHAPLDLRPYRPLERALDWPMHLPCWTTRRRALTPARPANAAEAEDRRMERFQGAPPALRPMAAPEEETNPLFPMTLDLRLPPPDKRPKSRTPGLVS
jgi:uncharacterized protein (DUF2126 family)